MEVDRHVLPDGRTVIGYEVPPSPPPAVLMPSVELPPIDRTIYFLEDFPAFDWCYGCSATSAAMIAAYWDTQGYPDIYSGSTNGGVMPQTNSFWGEGECPLSATHQGFDGLASRGNVDNYWIGYGNTDPDPYIQNGWTQHQWADCTADFMGTSQSAWSNSDGSTTFYTSVDGSPLHDFSACENYNPPRRDGCHGFREFCESRGYVVSSNFTQTIAGYDGNNQGFSFQDFIIEINNGNPVIMQMQGHSMVGFGYNSTTEQVYIKDTWDHETHIMTWGGEYSEMLHYGVTVCCLEPAEETGYFVGIDDYSCDVNEIITVDLYTSEILDSDNIISYQLVLNYDPAIVQFVDNEMDGTLSDGGFVTSNDNNGTLSIAYMTSSAISGSGTLLQLEFEGISNGNSALQISDFYYNTEEVTDLTNGILTVTSVNNMPIADAGEEYSGQADVTGFCEIMLNGTESYDIDGEIVSWQWTWESGSAEGEEVLAEFPTGTTEVTLTVTDNETGIDTDIAQVSISSYENLVPVAIADGYSLNEDMEFSNNVMTNDYDPDEYPPTFGLIAEPVSDVSNGTLDFADNGDFSYLPDLNWNGTDAFDYRIYDGAAYSVTVTVTLTVNPVNDAPEIDLPERFSFMENGELQVYFSEFADDVDNEELMLSVTGEVNVLVNISGMTVIFTAADSWSGSEILTFTVDDNQGRFTASDNVEIIVTPVTGISISKDITAGWNWFSLNVYNDDMSLNNVLGSLGDAGIYIKSQTQFADYYPRTGWFGSLDLINNYDFYRLDMAASGLLEFTGTPVNVNEMIYDLTSGWNWISYAAQTALGINDALVGLGDNAAYIKNQTQFSTYNPDYSWFGTLTVMQPLNGYMLDVNIAGEFTYPVPVRTMAYNDETVTEINPHAFEFNGSILMTADYDIPQDSRIMAYCNDELRGVSELLDYTKELGKKYYALMLYSDQENEAEFELYYQNSPIDELKSLGYNFTFTADMRIGDFIDPVIIELPITDTNGLSKSVISSYPNPFNPETTIEYELNEDGLALIEIYNVKGQKIETLVNETKQSGRYLLRWNAENRSSGIYYLSLKIGNTHQVKKLLLLR